MKSKIIFIFLTFVVLMTNTVFAATKEDVISAIKQTYEVGDSSFRLPDNLIKKAESYLKAHPLTEEKYDGILSAIDSAVAIAEKNGTTDITKIDRSDIREGLSLVIEAAESADVDLSKELSDNNFASEILNNDSNDEQNDAKNINSNDNITENTDENVENFNNEQAVESILNNLPSSNENDTSKNSVNIDKTVNRNLTFIIIGLILIIFVFIFIFYLIFKSRWYKIIKYILMIILVLLILVALVALVGILVNLEELRMIYKLYYIFK